MASFALRHGQGRIPAPALLTAAFKECCEIPVGSTFVSEKLGKRIQFRKDGLSLEEFQIFFAEALDAAKKREPIVETGNKYGVSDDFARMNGDLLLQQIRCSSAYKALSDTDRLRADGFFSMIALNADLRNRNPLHPTVLDSAVLSSLVNFPKHIFGFPFGGYSMSGHESLSLCFYSYRQECMSEAPMVFYVLAEGETEPPAFIPACCERLGLGFLASRDFAAAPLRHVVVVLTNFENPDLSGVAAWVSKQQLQMHIHILDNQLRHMFVSNAEPVHFDLPSVVRSVSLHEGLFNCGYQLYRDSRLRDLHFDVPHHWQTAYMSPNEGGSGNSTPLFIDFCFVLLGWSALRDVASKATSEANNNNFQPLQLEPYDAECRKEAFRLPEGGARFEEIRDWAMGAIGSPDLGRQALERYLAQFQRNFVGGFSRDVEAVVTSGGTRSINVSFESVLIRARKTLGAHARLKVVTGNPHLAVERAERRFQFQVVRTDKNGIIVMDRLREEIKDPNVVAVYAQTLSYTDGTTDPLPAIAEALEEENLRRQAEQQVPVTLINDSCLAFSVLVHNDGQRGNANYRVLELTQGRVTPTIVMLDAHKHLGSDKGVSMAMGTLGTLSHLSGHVRVGTAPSTGELVRAIADLSLVGVQGYYEKYHALVAAIDEALKTFREHGLKVIHDQNRMRGSTVFAIEDPSSVMSPALKKCGHGPAPIYLIEPSEPDRCQTGWAISLTPYCLRAVQQGKKALDIFVDDVLRTYAIVKGKHAGLAGKFAESSLPGVLLSGGDMDCWLLAQMRRPGLGRTAISAVLRGVWSAVLDRGTVCCDRLASPAKEVARRAAAVAAMQLLLLILFRRRRRKISKL